ncbi:DUF5074 domain-containing protein [Chitinophaga agrisoli]|uniref:DUF5074 domain-containing protein n=1 Tax=Chitinophaga agrisoli TaxID=2607653 RepID=A0A5B2VMT0_9BACT|nr:DUF5074 domain-containing protein [Chitinophaga agrisoli]KAA2239970.1 DUF5074 domain-containing protein [Chitinophaga agrisoli]
MKKQLLPLLLLLAAVPMLFTACQKEDALLPLQQQDAASLARVNATPNALLAGNYADGFFVANEGWFGHGTGDVHFYSYAGDSLSLNVYHKENPTGTLGTATSTLQYATIFNGKMYIVIKVGGPMVVVDANTMVETGRISSLPANDGHAFVGIDASHGFLSAKDGVYPVTLSPLSIGTKISGISGYTGDMIKAGSYVFALSQTDGVVAINTSNNTVAQKFGIANLAFAAGKDGNVYYTTSDSLIRINPVTLARTRIVKLPFTTPSPWGAWRHAAIASSTVDSAIYIVRNNNFAGGTQLYRYIFNTPSSITTPFITLPNGQFFYGAGVGYNKDKNELALTTINGSITGDVNRILIYNASTAVLKKTLTYNGWYFPAMPVFH